MSPAKPKKASSKSRKAAGKQGKPAARGKAPKAAKGRKTAKASGRKSAKRPGAAAKAKAPTHGGNVHAHCAATDPFGGACQNLPRRPSKYCVIHSYLDR
jgi:hypothetical protein